MAPKSKSDGKKPLPVQPDNDEKRVLDMLDEMPDSQPGSKKYKPALKTDRRFVVVGPVLRS